MGPARPARELVGDFDVLHVIGSLGPGGAERNLCYLAPWMARSRFRYAICCLSRRGEYADEVERLGVPVIELGHRRRHTLRSVFRLARLLRRSRVKIIHMHLFECGLIGRLAAWAAGVPVVITHEHGKTVWKKWYHIWFERLAIRRTDLRIAVSEDIRDLRIKHEATPPSKIVVIGNAVEPSRFEVASEVARRKRQELGLDEFFIIGTVGRLVEAKAYDLLLEVAREVCARLPQARFVLVGEGHLGESLKKMRDDLGLADEVRFLGKRSDIPELLAAMDLYVITSRREGLPVSLIEAMMAARPIVSTRVGGIPDAVADGKEAVLVEPDDRGALVQAVLGLAGDPAKMRSLGADARSKALATYSAHSILEALERIYTSLLKKKGIKATPVQPEGGRTR